MTISITDENLLARLVAFDTTSHRSNLPLVDFLCDYLDRPGVRITRHESPDGEKANLLVELGPPPDPGQREGLILSGHMDVVPALEPEWTSDPFELEERDGNLYGRGSADMKGFLALASNLAKQIDSTRLHAPLVLLFTYDEEVGTVGARHLHETWPEDHALPRRAIIGEPTELSVVRVHKGHLKLGVTLEGEGAHSAYPHLGRNAIEPAATLVTALAGLREELETERLESSVWFPEVPFPSLNVGTIRGGSAVNVVPDQCHVGFGIRLLPGIDVDALQARVHATVREALGDFPHTFETTSLSPPMALGEGSPFYGRLTQPVREALERDEDGPAAVSYATDAGWFQAMGIDCLLFGPGSIRVAHRPNEFLPRKELATAATILRDFCSRELEMELDPG